MSSADVPVRGTNDASHAQVDDGPAGYTPRGISRLGVAAVACSATGTVLGFIPLIGLAFLALNAVGVTLGFVCLVVPSDRRRWLSLSITAIALGGLGALTVWTLQSLLLHGRMH